MTVAPIEQITESDEKKKALPGAFLMRRFHSLLGLWLAIYLAEHLFVNANLALNDGGERFIGLVNKIQNIPYLKAVEIIFLAIPFLVHGAWGMLYAKRAKFNSGFSDGRKPSLREYSRNHAYSWQRITSWVLVVFILAHVIQMRFVDKPKQMESEGKKNYVVRVHVDPKLQNIADKVGARLFKEGDRLMAAAPSDGAALFLAVRETFKSPLLVILYSIFVVFAAFHGFNGLWTFMNRWGITVSRKMQRVSRYICYFLMLIVAFLGLAAAWGTYFIIGMQT